LFGTAWEVSDVIKLEVVGTEIRFYINGSLDVSMDTDGKYTDAGVTSGNPGVIGYGNGTGTRADDWEGGNVGGTVLNGGTIATNQSIVYNGDPAAFTSSFSASGGTESYTYTWQWSTTSNTAGSGNWNNISSSNSTIYNAGILTSTTYYTRSVNDGSNIAYSNVLTIIVGAPPGLSGKLLFPKGRLGSLLFPKGRIGNFYKRQIIETGDSITIVFAEDFESLPTGSISTNQRKIWNACIGGWDDAYVYVYDENGSNKALKIDFPTVGTGVPLANNALLFDSLYLELYFSFRMKPSSGFNYGGGGKTFSGFIGGGQVDMPYLGDSVHAGYNSLTMFEGGGIFNWYNYSHNPYGIGWPVTQTVQMPDLLNSHGASYVLGKDYSWGWNMSWGEGANRWAAAPTATYWKPPEGGWDYEPHSYTAGITSGEWHYYNMHVRLTRDGGFGDLYEYFKDGVCIFTKSNNRYRTTTNKYWGLEGGYVDAFFGGSLPSPVAGQYWLIDDLVIYYLNTNHSKYHTTALTEGVSTIPIVTSANKYVISPAMPKNETYTEASGTIHSHNHAFHRQPSYITVNKIIKVTGATVYTVNMTQYTPTSSWLYYKNYVKIYKYNSGVSTLVRTYNDTYPTLHTDVITCDSVKIEYYNGDGHIWSSVYNRVIEGWTATYTTNGSGSGTNPVYPSAENMVATKP